MQELKDCCRSHLPRSTMTSAISGARMHNEASLPKFDGRKNTLHQPIISTSKLCAASDSQVHDLCINSQCPLNSNSGSTCTNTLLEFCNIILSYTNYPDGFRDEATEVYGRKKQFNTEGCDEVKDTDIEGSDEYNSQEREKQKSTPLTSCSSIRRRKPASLRTPKQTPKRVSEVLSSSSTFPCDGGSEDIQSKRVKFENGAMSKSRQRQRNFLSPSSSVAESALEITHSSSSSTSSSLEETQPEGLFYSVDETPEESWDEITCFCGKPYSGRPMIECDNCSVWYHMSCAKLRKSNVPKKFYCKECKPLFANYIAERSRRGSGNSDEVNTTTINSYKKSTAKLAKNGSSRMVQPLSPLKIPHATGNYSPCVNPSSPILSTHFTKEEPRLSQTTLSAAVPSTSTSNDGMTSKSNEGSQLASEDSATICNSCKSPEKIKRRPTLNSASSGLYDDVLLNFRLLSSHNGV